MLRSAFLPVRPRLTFILDYVLLLLSLLSLSLLHASWVMHQDTSWLSHQKHWQLGCQKFIFDSHSTLESLKKKSAHGSIYKYILKPALLKYKKVVYLVSGSQCPCPSYHKFWMAHAIPLCLWRILSRMSSYLTCIASLVHQCGLPTILFVLNMSLSLWPAYSRLDPWWTNG